MAAAEYTLRDGIDAVRQPLPPGQNSQLDHEAPAVECGSFLDDRKGCSPDMVDDRPPAPIDAATGIPLILAPHNLSKTHPSVINFHHPWGKLWGDQAESIPEGERILRRSYGQRVLRAYHNGDKTKKAFHRLTRRTSVPIPEDAMDLAGALTLPQLGYIAPKVVDTSNRQLVVRRIHEDERQIAQTRRPAVGVSRAEIDKFQAKWCPEASREEAARTLWGYRNAQRRYSYQDIDSGSDYNHVRAYLTGEFVRRELADDLDGRFRRLLEQDDRSADEALLQVVVASVAALVTIRGTRLASLYPNLLTHGHLYPGMPSSLTEFLAFRLANPLGGLALNPALRNELLGREEEPAA